MKLISRCVNLRVLNSKPDYWTPGVLTLLPKPTHVQIVPIVQSACTFFTRNQIAPTVSTANLDNYGTFVGGSVIAVATHDLYKSIGHRKSSTVSASEVCKVILQDRHHRHVIVATGSLPIRLADTTPSNSAGTLH